MDKNTHERGLVSIGPYIPVFCAELACWLNEASWQAYNSPVGSPETEKQLDESADSEEGDDNKPKKDLDDKEILESPPSVHTTKVQIVGATSDENQV